MCCLYVEDKIQNISILDIDDQNTTYVLCTQGHGSCVLELKTLVPSKCFSYSSSALEE